MGITRDSQHKRRKTGQPKAMVHKKRKYDLGRQAANTKLATPLVRRLRVRGGNYKFRALRQDQGNYSWGTEGCTRKTRILDVMFNCSNNELLRTKTLTKNSIVLIDATPFRQWYEKAHKTPFNALSKGMGTKKDEGRFLACVSSRPGQSGRVDGYILEGKELEFYQKKIAAKKGKKGTTA